MVVHVHDQRSMALGRWSANADLRFRVLGEVEDAVVAKDTGEIFDVSQRGGREMAI